MHHPYLRTLLLGANVAFPPLFMACAALGWWGLLWVAISAAAISHALLFVAIFHPRCPWLGPVVREFRTDRKALWLTIDDGPDGDRTVQLAGELERRGVPATFFFVGDRMRGCEEVVRTVLAKGHTLANHTQTHPRGWMWCMGRLALRREIADCATALQAHGDKTGWFRAPVGHKSPWLHPALRAEGCRLIAWSTGGMDGWKADPSSVVGRVLADATPGGIILLHERRAHSVATVLAVVDALLAQGFEFVIPTDPDLV